MPDVTTRVDTPARPPTSDNVSTSIDGERRRHRDFAWLWGTYTVSTFGDQVTLVALPIAVFARTQSALAVGIAASMQTATALGYLPPVPLVALSRALPQKWRSKTRTSLTPSWRGN